MKKHIAKTIVFISIHFFCIGIANSQIQYNNVRFKQLNIAEGVPDTKRKADPYLSLRL
jgi:hypothetical protein